MSDEFYVWGGIFTTIELACKQNAQQPSKADLEDGIMEVSGPYMSKSVADQVALEGMRKRIDNGSHRLLVFEGSWNEGFGAF